MQTLLAKYLARPTAVNATRVVEYDRLHPFAVTTLDRLELGVLLFAAATVLKEMGR